MNEETLGGWPARDPDDLAVLICASLIASGVSPTVQFRFDGSRAQSINVTSNGTIIASLPLGPCALDEAKAYEYAKAIEFAARLFRMSR